MTQSDDPWAKWRQPAEPAAVPAAKVEPAPTAKAAAGDAAPPKPEGTLGVIKPADGATPSRKRPVRGGALTRKPREPKVLPTSTVDTRKSAKTGERPARPARPERSPRPVDAANPWRQASGDRPRGETRRPSAGERGERPRPPAKPPVAVPAGPAPSGVRLSKVMSERGLCSRREADLWIERGWVFVDGVQVSELGSRIEPDARIEVSTEAKKDQAKAVTILLHKPVGYVSGQPEPGCTPAVTLITAEAQLAQSGDPEFKPWMLRGLAPAGRLDVDSTGLLVLTSDGRVAKRLIGEDSDAEKEYLVRVSGQMIDGGLELLRHGLELDGKALKPAWVKQLNEDQLHFILKEGKKRQIRRMCELVGLKVIGLKRVRIGRIRLGDLPMGQWRFLRADEAF